MTHFHGENPENMQSNEHAEFWKNLGRRIAELEPEIGLLQERSERLMDELLEMSEGELSLEEKAKKEEVALALSETVIKLEQCEEELKKLCEKIGMN